MCVLLRPLHPVADFAHCILFWFDQANELLLDYEMGIIEHSGKMMILMDIISQSVALHEKILVFRCSVICQLSYFIHFRIKCYYYLQITVKKWYIFYKYFIIVNNKKRCCRRVPTWCAAVHPVSECLRCWE